MATSMISSRLETEICDKFKINALTEPPKFSMSAVIEGSDDFVSTQTGSGKSLTYECFPLLSTGKTVIVNRPINYNYGRADQKQERLGLRATYLGQDASKNELIENCEFGFMFGSSESFLNEKKWQDMLTSSVYQSQLQLSQCMRFQQCGMCDQQSLRAACAYALAQLIAVDEAHTQQ